MTVQRMSQHKLVFAEAVAAAGGRRITDLVWIKGRRQTRVSRCGCACGDWAHAHPHPTASVTSRAVRKGSISQGRASGRRA